jgi:hypothetical protein
MSEKLIEKIAASISRRGFLGTLSAASAALALGMFKIQGASASGITCNPSLFQVGCCCLFLDPRTCSYSGCGCEWVWTCIEHLAPESVWEKDDQQGGDDPKLPIDPVPCRRFSCKECYVNPMPNQTCTGPVKCSKATFTTIICAG